MSEQLRSIFARWQDLEAEKVATSNDLRELFVEAKGNGFDPKALRLAFRQKVKAEQPENDADRATAALAETYLANLDEPKRLPHHREMRGILKPRAQPAPARVEIIEKSATEPAAKPVDDVVPEPASKGVTGVAYPGDDDPLGPDLPAYLVRHPAASMERG